jgi:hypothetical protein
MHLQCILIGWFGYIIYSTFFSFIFATEQESVKVNHHRMSTIKYEDLDNEDPLRSLQEEFLYPQHEGKKTTYLCGNSLGLQSKGIQIRITEQLQKWTNQGVEGHFTGKYLLSFRL